MPALIRPVASVVIASRDKPAQLRLTLACLARQRDCAPLEVIVVDDSPEASAQPVVGAAHLDIIEVSGPGRGRAAARNAGAREATAGVLVFVDDDILVGERFVAAHLAALGGREFSHGRFCHGRLRELPASARLLRELDGADQATITGLADQIATGTAGPRYRLVANALERAIEAMADGTVADVAPWLGCVGANVSMHRSDFTGFAEEFGLTWGCEDLELGLRLHENGVRRVLAPDALGIHLSHARPGRWQEHGENMEKFIARHPAASVRALPVLLDAGGTVDGYVAAVLAAQAERTKALR